MVTGHEPTCISVARCARMIFCSLKLSLSTPLAFLAPICCVPKKMSCFAASYPPAASARSQQPRSSPCRWIPCPGPPDPDAASPQRPAGPAARHYVQNEQTGGTEVGRQGCRREKCQEALCSRLLLLSLLVVVPSSRWTCPEWCARKCWSKSFMIKFIFKSAASLRSMTPETRSEPNLDRKPQSGPMPSRFATF